MKYVQAAIIVLLIASLAGTVGWALSERSARLGAEASRNDKNAELKTDLAVLQTRHAQTAKSLKQLEDSVTAIEKWRNGAESRLAAADRKRDEPAGRLFRGLKDFLPAKGGEMMALNGRNAQRFTAKNKKGQDVTVSLMGAATAGPEIAEWMGLDAAKTRKLNALIHEENKRYAKQLAAKQDGGERRRFNFGMGGGDDGWHDFVNGKKIKELLNAEQREQLLQKFPKRCTVHMITTGVGDAGMHRVLIRPAPGMRGEEKEAPAPPPKGEEF